MNIESDDEEQIDSDHDLLSNEANFLYTKFQDNLIPKQNLLQNKIGMLSNTYNLKPLKIIDKPNKELDKSNTDTIGNMGLEKEDEDDRESELSEENELQK